VTLATEVFTRIGVALALTLAVEVPVGAALGLRSRDALVAVVMVNVATNPALNYLYLAAAGLGLLRPLSSWVMGALFVAAEGLVVIVEWRLLLWALGGRSPRMLAVSAAMNVTSVGLGLVLAPAIAHVLRAAGPLAL
jgi:hypothetical protein